MQKTTIALIAFVASCVAAALGSLAMPAARAQNVPVHWETKCVHLSARSGEAIAASFSTTGATLGRQGWEPFSTLYEPGSFLGIICFKRPAP